jgi:hypothetical protein
VKVTAPVAIISAAAFAGTASASSAGPGSTPACATSGLVVWLNTESGGAAAGSFYDKLP